MDKAIDIALIRLGSLYRNPAQARARGLRESIYTRRHAVPALGWHLADFWLCVLEMAASCAPLLVFFWTIICIYQLLTGG